MKHRVGLSLLAGILALGSAVYAADDSLENRRSITVVGQGESKVPPDLVMISFAVETVAARAGDAGTENAARSAAVAAAVKTLLGPSDQVTTTRYTLDPRYDNSRAGDTREPRITGYVARNEVQVETHKLDGVGHLIDAATAAGANRVGSVQFTLAKRDEATLAALDKAGAAARAQAQRIATSLGVQLKEVLSATTASTSMPMPRAHAAFAMAAEARVATPIEPGEISITATLQVTYAIE